MGAKEEIEGAGEAQSANALGSFIRKARTDVSMTLRDVEEATPPHSGFEGHPG